jgi:hypothetical protein
VGARRAWGPSYHRGSVPSWAEPAIQRHEGLKDVVKEMNLQRAGGATGGQSVAMNGTTINVNGVAPGREALMAKKTALALRDPIAEGLAQLKRMRSQEQRVGYV